MRSFDGAIVHSLVPGIFSAEMKIAPRVRFAEGAFALPEARRLRIRGGGVARRTRPVVAQERPDPERAAAPDPQQTLLRDNADESPLDTCALSPTPPFAPRYMQRLDSRATSGRFKPCCDCST